MLRTALLIAHKDVKLLVLNCAGLVQNLVLGLLLIFVFSLAQDVGDAISPRAAATIFWLASAFCLVLAGNMCHGLENTNNARTTLLLSPAPEQGIWLGKALSILVILLLAQICFLPASIAFLRQYVHGPILENLLGLLLIDLGLAALASLLGALAQGHTARESLLSIILFPLIVPVLLAGISFGEAVLSPGTSGAFPQWLRITLAFDAIFVAAGMVLFPFMYTDEE
jgi:heme exporter protein B